MKATISDVHGSHGLVFTLNLDQTDVLNDKPTMELLKGFLDSIRADTDSVLYVYSIDVKNSCVSISFSEERKRLARVDHLYNSWREDLKFVTICLDDPNNNQTEILDDCPHFVCHVCGNETWGVSRETMEVYDNKTKSIKLVSVHDKCKMSRLREVETVYAEA